MIDTLVAQLKLATGLEVHANRVPVNVVYPCIRYQVAFSQPYNTKSGACSAFTQIKANVYARNGSTAGYTQVLDKTEEIRQALNRLQIENIEFRVEDIWEDYEEETELYFSHIIINVFHDISQRSNLTLFSLEETLTGREEGGKPEYVAGLDVDQALLDEAYYIEYGFSTDFWFTTGLSSSTTTIHEVANVDLVKGNIDYPGDVQNKQSTWMLYIGSDLHPTPTRIIQGGQVYYYYTKD